jgi:hypothetical protein
MSKPELTMDQLREKSFALRSLLDQDATISMEGPPANPLVVALTGDDGTPPLYDLTAIWRAAQKDEHTLETPGYRRYMSPKRYINGWSHMIGATYTTDDGRVMADRAGAFSYCQMVDHRVMSAAINLHIEQRKEHARRDPIGNAVASARGGGFAMMFARIDARQAGWTDDGEFIEAVMERAKQDAKHLDDYGAEKLLSEVRQALEGCPKVEVIRP